MNAPCKNCPDRYPACHDKCQKYQTWLAEYRKEEAVKKEWKKQKHEDSMRDGRYGFTTKKRRY